MKPLKFASLVASLVLMMTSVQAHHSFAMFDKSHLVTIKGTVSKIEWQNPHSVILLDVPDGKGGKVQYIVECNSPNVLMRSGWKANSVKGGDEISVEIYPLRDGRPGGLLNKVILADGKSLKG